MGRGWVEYDTVGDRSRKTITDRARVVELVDECADRLALILDRKRGRSLDPMTLADEFTAVHIDQCAFDAAAANVYSQYVHGVSI